MRDTNIEVEVLDLGEFETDDGAPLHTGWAWGRVRTPAGWYVLCTEGVGPAHPISDERPWVLDLYARQSMAEGVKARLRFRPSLLADLPVKERVPLDQFVRQMGDRLERNYFEWKHRLEDAGVAA